MLSLGNWPLYKNLVRVEEASKILTFHIWPLNLYQDLSQKSEEDLQTKISYAFIQRLPRGLNPFP